MTPQLLYFISSLLIIGASVKSFTQLTRWKGVLLMAASVVYSIFCFFAFTRGGEEVMAQVVKEYARNYPTSMALALIYCGVLLNVITCIWIWVRGGLWKWCLAIAVVFCGVGACAGFWLDVSPLQSWYEYCRSFMGATGHVLGLTYVEFCVIGNIWVQLATIAGTAIFLFCASCRCLRSCSGGIRLLSVGSILAALLQIAASVLLLIRYAGTMSESFTRCVNDLFGLAGMAGVSYMVINLFAYVFAWVLLLVFNVGMGRFLMKRGELKIME